MCIRSIRRVPNTRQFQSLKDRYIWTLTSFLHCVSRKRYSLWCIVWIIYPYVCMYSMQGTRRFDMVYTLYSKKCCTLWSLHRSISSDKLVGGKDMLMRKCNILIGNHMYYDSKVNSLHTSLIMYCLRPADRINRACNYFVNVVDFLEMYILLLCFKLYWLVNYLCNELVRLSFSTCICLCTMTRASFSYLNSFVLLAEWMLSCELLVSMFINYKVTEKTNQLADEPFLSGCKLHLATRNTDVNKLKYVYHGCIVVAVVCLLQRKWQNQKQMS